MCVIRLIWYNVSICVIWLDIFVHLKNPYLGGDVLISMCTCLLNSIPKAKFDSTRGLSVSSLVSTWYLLISQKACPIRGYPTHQHRFLPGIKKLKTGFSQSLILPITTCMMTGPSFYFTLFEWLNSHDSWILWVFRFSSSEGVVGYEPPSSDVPD